MGIIKFCDRIIEYSFYLLFLLVPLVFTSATSELFELNKMWLTWGLTIIIVTSWLTKMILEKKFIFQRTPLDIPIALFLISQVISTIFSLDSHVSLWGYYSRFNGGLLSTITYILLYYAFVSNLLSKIIVYRLMTISLISGLIVALWGLPSHFGYDPTCLLFRGTFDTSCWTEDFIPTVRIFSTLGQPAWLSAYLAILIPISIAFFINNLKSNTSGSQIKNHESGIMNHKLNKKFIHNSLFIILTSLFYIDLLFTNTRSGFLGIWIALIFFFGIYIIKVKSEKLKVKSYLLIASLLLLITFVVGTPIAQLNRFTLPEIKNYLQQTQTPKADNKPSQKSTSTTPAPVQQPTVSGGTESGDIRLSVWTGAINAWKANPIFGTGVETFAFAYYKYKPASQNLTSEWNFLYNKAHNEYLNYLATTGAFGLGSYLLIIVWFLFIALRQFKIQSAKFKIAIQNSKLQKNELLTSDSNFSLLTLNFALTASYISILITNFFGFSVVITNIYLFMIPAFVFVLSETIKPQTAQTPQNKAQRIETGTSIWQWTPIFFIILASLFTTLQLFRFWLADTSYAHGYALDRAGEYQTAYPYLQKAIQIRAEPVFKDEFSVNNAIIATSLVSQIDENNQGEILSLASQYVQQAVNTSNEVVSQHPNNVVFWKTRTKLFHTLSQADARYLSRGIDAIEKAAVLAPQDANVFYNLGVLQGQNNNIEKGIEALEKATQLKPNYYDAQYALSLFYREIATDESGKVINSDFNKKAIDKMEYILKYISPENKTVQETLENWSK